MMVCANVFMGLFTLILLIGDTLLIKSSQALYPWLTYVPVGSKITGNPKNDMFSGFEGSSAISSNGKTLAAVNIKYGAFNDVFGINIYVRVGDDWQTRIFRATPPKKPMFVSSVAISANGQIVVVGAHGADDDRGAIYIFQFTGKKLRHRRRLVEKNRSKWGYFGEAVAISADGSIVCAGRTGRQNRVVCYKRSGKKFAYKQLGASLIGTAGEDALQGHSLALSGKGNILVFGGPHASHGDVWRQGGFWVHERDLSKKKSVFKQVGDKYLFFGTREMGSAVAISYDGQTIVASATTGVFLYLRGDNGLYTLKQRIRPDSASPSFGKTPQSVALTNDGLRMIVGDSDRDLSNGGGYFFARSDKVALFSDAGQGAFTGANATGIARQGHSVAISKNGHRAVLLSTDDNYFSGAFWTFGIACLPSACITQAECTLRQAICSTYGIQLKFIPSGCSPTRPTAGSGECQCVDYCGFTTQQACTLDTTCEWRPATSPGIAAGCFSKTTGARGQPVSHCISPP